jgi:hypothetical protein
MDRPTRERQYAGEAPKQRRTSRRMGVGSGGLTDRFAIIAGTVAVAGVASAWMVYSLRSPGPRDSHSDSAPEVPGSSGRESGRGRLAGPFLFHEVSKEAGIRFVHTHGGCGRRYIMESVSAGLATFDYDGDGLTDIYFLNGAPLRGTQSAEAPANALFRNEGNWKFTDVTAEAGVGDTGYGLGVAVGDYDNDGNPDLYLNNFGPNVLYRNNGDGTFTETTELAGAANGDRVGAGTCFLDIEADGDLDLYVANYVKNPYEDHVTRYFGGYPRYPGPRDFQPDPDTLFRNNGDGTFTDISAESGVAGHAGTGMGMVAGDFDNDGDTDVFVANDVAGNFLFLNDGTGRFDEAGLTAGAAYNLYAQPTGSMGADCADYDNDGWLDLFMTAYQGELPVLYRNLGNGSFEDATAPAGAGAGTYQYVNWGVGLVDFDNDGDRDAFVANGHVEDLIEMVDQSTSYHAPNVVLMNTGDGKFVDVSHSSGDGLAVKLASRGAAFDDLDNDGDIDVVVLNSNRESTVLRNDTTAGRHWVDVCLTGIAASRDGVGSRVKVVAGNLTQVAEVHSGRGYQSHFGSRLHFGLGGRDRVDRIEVHWMGGGVDVLEDAAVDRLYQVRQFSGR